MGRMWTVLADVRAARDVDVDVDVDGDGDGDADGDGDDERERGVSERIYVSGRERRVAWFLYVDMAGFFLVFLLRCASLSFYFPILLFFFPFFPVRGPGGVMFWL